MPREVRPVSLLTAANRIEIFVRRERVATYRYGDDAPSGFTAVYAADDTPITQPGPAGPALWVAHGNVNGVAFGTREEGRPTGTILVRDFTARRGTQSVGFQQESDWRDPRGELLLTEVRTVRVLPGPGVGRILDFDLRLRAPDHLPVTLGQTGHSLLLIRAASGLFAVGTSQVRNSRGDYGPAAIHGRNAAWCACIGVVQGKTVGFALLEHPDNPFSPSPWLCRADGLVSPTPFIQGEERLSPGSTLRLRYRLHIYSGYVERGWADARLAEYVKDRYSGVQAFRYSGLN
jgi:hypothetical protein